MKVVKQLSTNKIAYRQIPDFEGGKGILNAHMLFPKISIEDLREIEITEEEWNNIDKLNLTDN